MKRFKTIIAALCVAAVALMGTAVLASAQTDESVAPYVIDLSNESFFENAVASFVPSGGKGAVEKASSHWTQSGSTVTRKNDTETADVEGNYAALYFNDCYLRYFELDARVKYGQRGLTGIIFGKKDVKQRHIADGNALYFLPDPCVELKGSTLTAKKTSAKFIKCFVDGELKLETEVPEELIGYGRLGLFTANAAGSFSGNVEIYSLDARGNRIAFQSAVLTEQITVLNDSAEMEVGGESKKFDYAVLPENAANKNVRFYSENPDIATCDLLGNIHALKAGSTEIYAITEDGGFRAAVRVTVTETKPVLSGITLSQNNGEINVGEKLYLSAGITPDDAENLGFRWSSSNNKVAMVNNGTVTALGEGECTITVKDYNGEFSAECKITVKASEEKKESGGCGSSAGAVAPVAAAGLLLVVSVIAAVRRKKENV